MKKFTNSWIRVMLLSLVSIFALQEVGAATVQYGGIYYTTSGTKATVKKYAISGKDTTFYKGDIVIPETFELNGVTYTVIATGANAFLDCRELTSLTLPATCVTIGRNSFKGCTALTNDPVPPTATSVGNGYLQGCTSITEVTVPAGIKGTFTAQNWEGMTSLKKITFTDSPNAFKITVQAFVLNLGTGVASPIEEIYFGRNLDESTGSYMPFRGIKTLKKVTFGGNFTNIDGEMFQGCTGLTEVIYNEGVNVTSVGAGAFANCTSLKSLTIPETITSIPDRLCYGAKALTSITMSDNVTSIGATAFYNSGLTSFNFPSALQYIYSNAFQNSAIEGTVSLPAGVQSIGTQAFAGTKVTKVEIPAAVASIGSAAFAPITTLAEIVVDEANTAFKVVNGVLVSANGARLLVSAHQGTVGTDAFAAVTNIDNYGLAYAPCEVMELPALEAVGNYAFANSALKAFTIKANVTLGSNIFNNSALESIVFEDGRNEIPQGICAGCSKLNAVTLPSTATNIMKDAFANCPSLKHMEIPANVNYMEPGAVPTSIESLRVLNPNTPALAANVFSASQSGVECKVASSAVAKYKAASQWQYLNIVADPTIASSGVALGCPTGLYFATTDGKLMYKDVNGEIVDTKFTTGAHAFTLHSYKNRIYVAVAGEKFTYQNPDQPLGDGELFYVNNTNGIFYRVTVLNNVGYKPSEDPFSMYIDKATNNIYIADRNVGVHKLNADTTGLYGSQPFLFQNQWLPYYGDLLSYGAITGGFTRDSRGCYWRTTKFNGLGLTRFRDSDIYSEGGAGKTQPYNVLFKDVIIKTSYLDEANGYYYMYVQKDPNGAVPGIYRIALNRLINIETGADVEGNAELKISDCQLIDDSPVLLDGAPDSGEIANVAQINGDGTNVFWSYVAPESDDQAVAGSVALDAANPLHKSGIKTIVSADAQPVVTYAVENVKAYGLCGATYVAPPVVQPESIELNKTETTVDNGGDTVQLIATVLPEDADNKNVVWTSSDESIATVDANGLVTTIKQTSWEKGATCAVTIKAACEANPELFAECRVVILNPTAEVLPTSIKLNYEEYVMPSDANQVQLVATVLPAETTNPAVNWTSSDENVATVDKNGLVTIVSEKAGVSPMATNDRVVFITASCVANADVKATCTITVPGKATGVTDINGTKTIKNVRYYNVAGMESTTPYQGVNLVVTNYTDGSQSVSKLVK